MKLFLILFTITYSQDWRHFHLEELNNYQNIYINYHQIDILVNDSSNLQRNSLSHKVIGYLPYWEYDSYPYLDYTLLTEINYFSAELNEYGNIINDHNWDNIGFIDYAQSQGVRLNYVQHYLILMFGLNQ